MAYAQPRSPELKHPVPTHPAYIPEPPATPNSPQGYQRFVSSPPDAHAEPAHPAFPTAQPYGGGYAHPQQQQQHPAFQQAQARMAAAVPPPDYGAWGVDAATTQLGMQIGQGAFDAGRQYVDKNFGTFLPGAAALKHHFNVSSAYVLAKLRLVLFPWKHRAWTRKVLQAPDGAGPPAWVPPREDINSPDLYIPAMALVTYVLLAGLATGLRGQFHPEILAYSASKALGLLLVDWGFVALGCYVLNVQDSAQSFDLVSYAGYKFVGVIVTVLAGLLGLGRLLYTSVFAYAFLANGFFLLRSLRQVVLADVNTTPAHGGTLNPTARKRRITFLFLVAVSQLLYMGVLVRV